MKNQTYLLALVLLATVSVWIWTANHGHKPTLLSVDDIQGGGKTAEAEHDYPDKNLNRRIMVDPLVKERYLKVPPGLRNHPSYYSEAYLLRAQERTPAEAQELTDQWGSWTLVDAKSKERASNDFYNQFPNRDVPHDSFPDTAWQKDAEYLQQWLTQALALTNRTLEAILSEYGRGMEHLPDQSFWERSEFFRLTHDGPAEPPDKIGGWMNEKSYQGLKRRLLHAVMAQDRFNIVMGGHSAAAGHGNVFQQSYTIQIARILEPIFARLGVKFTARNFGMGGLGTLQNAMAAGDIYGSDVDILMWDSSMTERSPNAIGVFAIQGLLGSDRAPLLWFWQEKNVLNSIHQKTGADIAIYGDGMAGFSKVTDSGEMENLPYALQWVQCGGSLGPQCVERKYAGQCWIDRDQGANSSWAAQGLLGNYEPPEEKKTAQMGGQVSWHPGWRRHQIRGRSYAFAILLALQQVLEEWQAQPNYIMPDTAWHVTNYYKAIQDEVRSRSSSWVIWCKASKLPVIFCQERAHGRTENAPRNKPWATSIRSIMAGMPSPGLNPIKNLYDPPDVHMPWLDPPKDQVDVLAVAENGVPFDKNLARVHDSAVDMSSPTFSDDSTVTKTMNPDIQPGKGWTGGFAGSDNCDGEHDSFCDRGEDRDCLLYGHNDHRNGLLFDGFSGWSVFRLNSMKHGTIVIKLHSWYFLPTPATNGWCSENNEKSCQSRRRSMLGSEHNASISRSGRRRQLKAQPPAYCPEFKFEFAIDGQKTTWDLETWKSKQQMNERVVETWTLMNDPDFVPKGETKDVELAFRVTGCGRSKAFELTHLYWL